MRLHREDPHTLRDGSGGLFSVSGKGAQWWFRRYSFHHHIFTALSTTTSCLVVTIASRTSIAGEGRRFGEWLGGWDGLRVGVLSADGLEDGVDEEILYVRESALRQRQETAQIRSRVFGSLFQTTRRRREERILIRERQGIPVEVMTVSKHQWDEYWKEKEIEDGISSGYHQTHVIGGSRRSDVSGSVITIRFWNEKNSIYLFDWFKSGTENIKWSGTSSKQDYHQINLRPDVLMSLMSRTVIALESVEPESFPSKVEWNTDETEKRKEWKSEHRTSEGLFKNESKTPFSLSKHS